MTKNKELLLKDLCARLPYGLKVKCEKYQFPVTVLYAGNDDEVKFQETGGIEYIYATKPYLFPLSSITIEQEKELSKLGVSYGEYALHDDIRGLGIMVDEAYIFFEFCYKHHIDFLGLIEKGLAIDATGKNIY